MVNVLKIGSYLLLLFQYVLKILCHNSRECIVPKLIDLQHTVCVILFYLFCVLCPSIKLN